MGIKNMQGTSAFIEYHWEALPEHDYSVDISCVYSIDEICTKEDCKFYSLKCVGFTGCPSCTTPNHKANTEFRENNPKYKKAPSKSSPIKVTKNKNKAIKSNKKNKRHKTNPSLPSTKSKSSNNSEGYILGADTRLSSKLKEIKKELSSN